MSVRNAVLVTLLFAVFASDALAQADTILKPKTDFQLEGATTIQYKEASNDTLDLHVYYPDGWTEHDSRSAIVFFFGGGWVGGTPKQFAPQCEHLAKRGMVAITAEYRVKSRHGVHPAECVADAKDAVRYVREHANELGIDNARIAVAGGSAGGHVAASTATVDKLPEEGATEVSCTPNALILYNPVSDTSMLGYGGGRLGERMVELSPLHNIKPHMPPTLIFHGNADKTVPYENAQRFKRMMDEAGNACELVTYEGAGHGFFNEGRKNNQYEDTTRRLDEFLVKLGYIMPNADTKVAGRTLAQWKSKLSSADATSRRRAAESIGQFGPLAADTFVAMLDNDDDAIRYVGASHIGDHKAPMSAKEKLRGMLNDNSRGVSLAAAYAVCRLGDLDAGLPVLEKGIFVKERGTACSAGEFLARVGPPAAKLAETIDAERAKQANKGDYHIRGALQNALRHIRRDTKLVAHKRPAGGGNPRGWKPSSKVAGPATNLKQKRPNILWISCEDISPNLGCYGDTYARTPNLDQLAREGARFDRAFTPAGVCAVIRSGLITGVYPISQGSQHMRSNIVLPTGVKCFPEYLRAAGYFCTNKSKTDYQFAPPKTVWDRQGNNHNDWRDRKSDQPFFSVINLTISHESQIRHGEKTHAAMLDRLSADQHHNPDDAGKYLPPFHPNTPEARKDWARYADNISEMDRQAGSILQQLEEDGLADNTIVVFWGDHGRGLPRGKRWIYDSGVLVPFIVRWPGQVQPGTARPDLVSTQDLAPTMLSIAGVDVPDYMQGRVIVGNDAAPEPDFLFFHRDRMDEAYELMRAARDHRYKYIRNYKVGRTYAQNIDYMNMMPTLVDLRQMHVDGELTQAQSRFFRTHKSAEELYDLEKDPHETVNLAWMPEHADRIAKMRTALEDWEDDIVDLGYVPEPVMMEQMRPNDKMQQVAPPEFSLALREGKPQNDEFCMRNGGRIDSVSSERRRMAALLRSNRRRPRHEGRSDDLPSGIHRQRDSQLVKLSWTLRATRQQESSSNGAMKPLITFTALLGALLTSHAIAKPSFVFILCDDLGVMDIGIEGSTFHETPHIDALAKRGMRFTQGYATCQVCSPSRASIMTGKFPARHGITDWIGAAETWDWKRNGKVLPAEYERHLNHDDTTIAEALKANGYKTFFAGKWHLGTTGSHPEDHGFDTNKGGYWSGSPRGGYFAPYKNPELEDGPTGESLPVRLANETKKFVEQNKGEQFFAFLSFYSVHGPIQTSKPLWQKYRDKATAQGSETKARFVIDRTMPVRQVQDCPIYGGMMESMDDAVGIVMKCLDDQGLSNDTVVIFTSDNGGVSSGDAFATSNLPLRGGKGRQWEGGIREPYYVVAPGVAKPGTTSDTPVTGADFYPTMLELAGLEQNEKQHADGKSILPLLKGETIPKRPLYWHYPHYGNQGGEPSSIIRRDNWKLIHYWEDDRDELYDLDTDPFEKTDVVSANKTLAADMYSQLIGYLAEVGARIPARDPRYSETLAKKRAEDMKNKRLPGLEKQHANFLSPDFSPNKTWWDSKAVRD